LSLELPLIDSDKLPLVGTPPSQHRFTCQGGQRRRRAQHARLRICRASSGKATAAFSKYIVVDMYAKAVQGMKAEDAVKWAEGELKKVYES